MNRSEVLMRIDKGLENALFTIADSELSKTAVLQGGGALHFIYSSPRYSNDIDFVDKSIRTLGIENYAKEISQIGERYKINRVNIMKSNLGLRAKWGNHEESPLAKVEIEQRALDSSFYRSSGKFNILVKSPVDIYTDKIFANISRYVSRRNTNGSFPFKPNDFFDLNYLVSTLGINPVSRDTILERAKDYDSVDIVNNSNLNDMIKLITKEDNHNFFVNCIKKTMSPDIFKLLTFDKIFFNKIAEHFENYKI